MFVGWKKQVLKLFHLTVGSQLPWPDDPDLQVSLKYMYDLGFTPEQAADSLHSFCTQDPMDAAALLGDRLSKKSTNEIAKVFNDPRAEDFVKATFKAYRAATKKGFPHDLALAEMIEAGNLSSKKERLFANIQSLRHPSLVPPGVQPVRPSEEQEMKWLACELFKLRFGGAGTSTTIYFEMSWELIDRCYDQVTS